jgi:hypothetical protein
MASNIQPIPPIPRINVDPLKCFNALLTYKPQINGNSIFIPGDSYQKYDSICDFFSEEIRLKTKRFDEKSSPADYWKKNHFQMVQISKKTGQSLDELLYQACKGQVNFKLTGIIGLLDIASTLINKPLTECTLFDPSAGNGGIIFAGAAKLCKHIIANDPNTALIKPYEQIRTFFQTIQLKTPVNIHCTHQPFSPKYVYSESIPHPDIIFTSPPFFDIEDYSSESTQSIRMYPIFKQWLDLFLIPYLTHCMTILNDGGLLMIHYVDFPRARATSTILKHLQSYYVQTIQLKSTKRCYSTTVYLFKK